MKNKILFLGETYRADAMSWINGLKEFGNFKIETLELPKRKMLFSKVIRIFDFIYATFRLRKKIKSFQPNLIIAERITSYGFLASTSNFEKIAIAQQGITDVYPENNFSSYFKELMQRKAIRSAGIIHAWGEAMVASMYKSGANSNKIFILPKGIDLRKFSFKKPNPKIVNAIVTRSLYPEYNHELIIRSFAHLKHMKIQFKLVIVGDGILKKHLKSLSETLGISNDIKFIGAVDNSKIPYLLSESNLYVSMPVTEGVSSSLFEAMAAGCYPVVSDLRANRSWIRNRENGSLVKIDDIESLVNEILFFYKNFNIVHEAVITNRKLVEQKVSYETNMKIISNLYKQYINN